MAKHSYALRPVTKRCDVGAERGAQGRTPRALRGVATQRAWVFYGRSWDARNRAWGFGGSIVLPSPTFVFGNLRRFRRIEKCVRIRKSGISYNCIECNLLDLDHGVLL